MSGDSGTDALNFNGANIGEAFSLVADGTNARLNRNVANVSTGLAALEQVNLRTLAGADTLSVGDLTGTTVRGVSADLRGFDGNGDAAVDQVFVSGTAGPDKAVLSTDGTTGIVDGLSVDVRATGMEPDGHRHRRARSAATTRRSPRRPPPARSRSAPTAARAPTPPSTPARPVTTRSASPRTAPPPRRTPPAPRSSTSRRSTCSSRAQPATTRSAPATASARSPR